MNDFNSIRKVTPAIPNDTKFPTLVHDKSPISDHDIYLFKAGLHFRLYEKLGSQLQTVNGVPGVHFAVWAPNAQDVSVVGDFNGWDPQAHPLSARWDSSGIWEGFILGLTEGSLYKYSIISKHHDRMAKADPFAFYGEIPPQTASLVWGLDYQWHDRRWMKERHRPNQLNSPVSIYEMHLGSWRRMVEEKHRFLSYRELAGYLVDYLKEMGFTHVEFMPVMNHPFYGSWGYQTIGYFAPTAWYGTPQELMYLVDCLHQKGIGVILDWVPSHFPVDEHGLADFDGTHLYEHADPRQGFHPDWKSYIFNHGRHEVSEFLISSALFWLDKYHADGLRVDAVASMLYLDYSRQDGEWIPNPYGGRENIDAIRFLKQLNKVVYEYYPDCQMIAEESTAWPMVSKPTYLGGLGFGMKWYMGWMHDTLSYFSKDPIHRKYHHNDLTFSMLYAFNENFVLSLSHDEVVHGKSSLLGKMPGDDWQKFANLRLLYGYQYAHPGKKLLFMGGEFGQWSEWDHEKSLDWHLVQYSPHQALRQWVKDLNNLYCSHPALYAEDFSCYGFEWIDCNDWENSILSFLRKDSSGKKEILVVCNFTPVVRLNYSVGVSKQGFFKEVLNSDAAIYGGSNQGNGGGQSSTASPYQGREFSLSLTLPPLGILFLELQEN